VNVAKKFGYELELIEGAAFQHPDYGINHCWTIFDNKIIDLTATQFNVKNKIHIVSIKNKEYTEVSRGKTAIKNVKEYWCDQSPHNYRNELNKRKRKIIKIIQSII